MLILVQHTKGSAYNIETIHRYDGIDRTIKLKFSDRKTHIKNEELYYSQSTFNGLPSLTVSYNPLVYDTSWIGLCHRCGKKILFDNKAMCYDCNGIYHDTKSRKKFNLPLHVTCPPVEFSKGRNNHDPYSDTIKYSQIRNWWNSLKYSFDLKIKRKIFNRIFLKSIERDRTISNENKFNSDNYLVQEQMNLINILERNLNSIRSYNTMSDFSWL